MGLYGSKPTQPKHNTGLSDQSALELQYKPSFEALSKNHNFFVQLMHENSLFAANLFKEFPGATTDFNEFFEMVIYLRRQQAKYTINKYAMMNGHKTTLLDRFFMIILEIQDYKKYEEKVLNRPQLDFLLMEYFKIFIPKPLKGSIDKILKFIDLEGQQIKIKEFSSNFRMYFPNVQRYLKDYYKLKFNKLQKNGHLMQKFNSKIIDNDGIILALKIPRIVNPEIVQLYDTDTCGISFSSYQKKLYGYTGPWLTLIHHTQKNEQNEKVDYVFGAYQNGPIKNVLSYQGDVTGFLFSLQPRIKFYTTDKGLGFNHYFYIQCIAEEKCKRRRGIGFGGNQDKEDFKLWIDEDIDKSTVGNGKDPTYGYGALAGPGTKTLSVRRMEIWGLGGKHDIEAQKEYWIQRQQEITKRRKVDKRQFVDNNADLFFSNTFAHRDQVYGEIEKNQKKQE